MRIGTQTVSLLMQRKSVLIMSLFVHQKESFLNKRFFNIAFVILCKRCKFFPSRVNPNLKGRQKVNMELFLLRAYPCTLRVIIMAVEPFYAQCQWPMIKGTFANREAPIRHRKMRV